MRALGPPEVAVERPQRHVPSLSRKVQHEAIGKAQGGPRAKQFERSFHHVRILYCQVFMTAGTLACGWRLHAEPVNRAGERRSVSDGQPATPG